MESLPWKLRLGANFSDSGKISFLVWAPRSSKLSLKIRNDGNDSLVEMKRLDEDFFYKEMDGVSIGDLYSYVLENGKERPDPVSRYLPEGLHGRTEIVNPDSFKWTDNAWKGLGIDEFIIRTRTSHELAVATTTGE